MPTLRESASLGSYQTLVEGAIERMAKERILPRIWEGDHTVWKPEPTEVSNRLGWLHSPGTMKENLKILTSFAEDVRAAHYTHALLLGMGGSSLAPEVFRRTFGVAQGYLDLAVLDSTVPGAILAHVKRLDLARTLFIVSTKSGTTPETISLFKFFFNCTAAALGINKAVVRQAHYPEQRRGGEHFIAITDPGSKLADLAQQHRFRATFLNDPNIGGRYSALSYFGLAPAALLGMDLPRLLDRGLAMAHACGPDVPAGENPAAWLGAILAELATAGRDKATLVFSPRIASFGDWVEQLIAESTGKEGRGIIPIVGDPLGPPAAYGDDRLFLYLHLDGDDTCESALAALEKAGQPVVRLCLQDVYDLGAQFFLWEMAVAIAGHCLGINPFDQPDVESAKVRARDMVSQYKGKGSLPMGDPALSADDIAVYGDAAGSNPGQALCAFLAQAQPAAYVALQAYLCPTPETAAALAALRLEIRDRTRLATTVGYGPRFLHSTGQLHKGDGGRGLFIQFTADDIDDLPIPDVVRQAPFDPFDKLRAGRLRARARRGHHPEQRRGEAGSSASAVSFGVLKMAQALGDAQALRDAGRRVIRFHLEKDAPAALSQLAETLK